MYLRFYALICFCIMPIAMRAQIALEKVENGKTSITTVVDNQELVSVGLLYSNMENIGLCFRYETRLIDGLYLGGQCTAGYKKYDSLGYNIHRYVCELNGFVNYHFNSIFNSKKWDVYTSAFGGYIFGIHMPDIAAPYTVKDRSSYTYGGRIGGIIYLSDETGIYIEGFKSNMRQGISIGLSARL